MPLDKLKAAAVTTKLMHSVVILVNAASGIGHMLEYTNENNGSVKMSPPGRLAEKSGYISNHRCYKAFESGFQSCRISLKKLVEFNHRFQNLCDYRC